MSRELLWSWENGLSEWQALLQSREATRCFSFRLLTVDSDRDTSFIDAQLVVYRLSSYVSMDRLISCIALLVVVACCTTRRCFPLLVVVHVWVTSIVYRNRKSTDDAVNNHCRRQYPTTSLSIVSAGVIKNLRYFPEWHNGRQTKKVHWARTTSTTIQAYEHSNTMYSRFPTGGLTRENMARWFSGWFTDDWYRR